jgi:outer membrane receptor protein involved in Fe transport
MRYRARSWPLGLLGLVAGLSTVPGHAGEAEPGAIVVLGAALDLPPGTPAYGTAVIDHARLQADAAGRVEDVLKDVAGFSQFRRSDSRSANASAQGANLRGIGGNAASRTLLLLDGVPMADPFFGYIPYSAIVPERLSAIRVTRGAGTGAFGAGAVAGILEMASATRADLPLVSASGLYGSRDATELSATFSPDVGAGFVSVSARWDRGDGFQTSPPEQRVAASVPARYDSWSGSVRAVAPLGGSTELQARLLVFRDGRTLRFAGADSHSEGQDASLRLISRGPWQVDALAYVQARNFSNIVISATSFRRSLDQRDTPALGLGGKIELRPPVGGGHVLRLGVDARRASGDMFEDAYNAGIASNPVTARRHASGRQLTTGAFVEDDWTLGRLVLTGGARIDRWTITEGRFESQGTLNQTILFPDRSGWEAGGRAGVLWKASDGVALRAAAYTGFRLPTLNELYRSFVVFPVTTQANAGLAPEHLRGAEAGVDLTPAPGVSLGLTAFENRLEDAIANVTVGANLRQRQNVPAIVARGVELTAGARIGDFDLSGSYAYSLSRVKAPGSALDGLRPAQTPRHAGSATLAWLPEGGARLAATLRYVGRQYEDDLNIDSLPGALTVDGFASVPIGRGVTVIGRAENIFDKTVITRNAGGSIDLGTPRTLWIGIRFAGS